MNLRSMKRLIENEITETASESNTNGETTLEKRAKDKGEKPLTGVFHTMYNLQDKMDRQMYTDQTGKFPIRSYRGM